ncbi:MAG: hypothetical protein HKN79_09515 [Flavobacteriales bacterium]|nr:hypothetical protein [Flavobacteriales bacterium]
MKRWIEYIPLLALTVFCLSMQGQDNYLHEPIQESEPDEAQWTEALEDRDYVEESDPVTPVKDTPSSTPFDWGQFSWLVYVMIGLLVIGLVFLLVKVLSAKQNRSVGRTTMLIEDLDDLDTDLEGLPLDRLLREALNEKRYRMAIRIMYLIALQEMESSGWIRFRKDKTNLNYLREMGQRPERYSFSRLTMIFESVWYGNVDFSAQHFETIRPAFDHYIDHLRQDGERAEKG